MFKWLFKKKGCAKHMNNKLEVIGIDHGWSMMKTISQVFVTGVKEITTTPALFGDVLEYEGKFYKVGTVRQEVKDTKVEDDSFYLLTLAAVAKELKRRGLEEAKVFLAVGLPLTRFGAEKNDFIKYLTKNKRVSFKYENEPYYIEIDDVAIFPQCYAAVVDKIPTMAKKTLIVDIGSWTIDIMPVINKSPDESKCVTIPKGLITCMRSINEQCVRQLNGEVDESEIQNIMRYGRSDIDDEYFAIIKAEIEDFVDKVYNSIREFGYNLKTTPIVFVGGGAVVMKNFGSHDAKNISYNLDVKANAKGELFVSMPRYRSNERDESNGVIYKDVCNPITAEFREELYTNILDAYARIKEPEKEETQMQDRTQGTKGSFEMPEFSVTVTPYEREGSNIKGLARIYFENSFIVNNINIVQGKEKIFVSMPSYKTKQVDEQGKPIYQDVCYPVTKDFREKLYNEIISEYEKAKDKSNEKARESAEKNHGNPDKEKDKEATPFR